MKKFEFESNGSKWLLVDSDNYGRVMHPEIEYLEVCRLKNITEEQASEVVEYGDATPSNCVYTVGYKDYNTGEDDYWYESSIESLRSLFKSKGIHLFENPYRDDWDELCTWGHGDFSKDGKSSFQLFTEAEKNTFYNPVLFKIL